ncbi:MAG: restriction endonuclease subunit S [Planctomycetota bacterium]|jgi:type I restriction enzyme S subunit|nr:restriction endonuclease subunit S [Planctomycetota bacterium]
MNIVAGDRTIPWRNEVTEDWPCGVIKYECRINPEVLSESTNPVQELDYIDIGGVSSTGVISTPERIIYEDAPSRARRLPKYGDTIISTVRTYLKAIAAIDWHQGDPRLVCSTGFAILRSSGEVDPRFLYWWMRSDRIVNEIVSRSTGVSYPAINASEIGCLSIPKPPTETQRRIAAFLDRKTAAIDALIAKKQRLITLLKEKRQALITHAVTKGLNPNAPMKDSGIPWIGCIPEHWSVAQVKRFWKVIDCKHKTVPFLDNGEYPLASIGEVKGLKVDLATANRTSEEYYHAMIEGGRRPTPGDIIYSRNATVGESALVVDENGAFAMGQDVCLIRPQSGSPMYAWLQLNAEHITNQLEAAMVGATFRRINVGVVKCFWACAPPDEEQAAIAAHCQTILQRTDSFLHAQVRSLAKLTEYRQALITAAVTGQLPTPEVAA